MKAKLPVFLLLGSLWVTAGVRKEIENLYLQKYKNKAIFLKVPVRGVRQVLFVTESGVNLDRTNAAEPVAFKVGDQVRITDLSFKDDQIRFKIAAVDLTRESELWFQFDSVLRPEFFQQKAFDAALAATLTEGLHYAEIDSAKEKFIQDQFDQLIRQFAATTGTSTEFVIKAISEKNPEHQAAKKEAADAVARLQDVSKELGQATRARREAESQVLQLRSELSQTRSALETGREERQRLITQRDSWQQQVAQLQQRNQEHERQVNELIKSLNVKTTAHADLGKRVEALSSSIDNLKTERTNLSQKLEQVGKELEKYRKTSEDVAASLKQAQADNTRLTADLRALTSNRNSLEARYLSTRKQKEILERAAALRRALRLEKKVEEQKEGLVQVGELYLLNQKVGAWEVTVPRTTGKVYPVRFSVLSPDTVQFSQRERELYEALGQKFKVETGWVTASDRLKSVLVEGKTLREVAPREKTEWAWLIDGEIVQPERAVLRISLINADGQTITLDPQEFMVNPSGIVAQLRHYFSPISLAAGALLGVLGFGLIFGFRSRSRAVGPGGRTEAYVAPKKL